MVAIGPLLQKLEISRDILRELGCGRFVSAYVEDVAVLVSDISEIEVIGTNLWENEVVTGVSKHSQPSVNRAMRLVEVVPWHSIED